MTILEPLGVVHVEADLVHLAWQLAGDTFDLERRDADEADAPWQSLVTGMDGAFPFWRDSTVVPGIRYEYRLTAWTGGARTEAVKALDQPVPEATGQAGITVIPGMAEVVPEVSIPSEANPFAGIHSDLFHLTPDPGPTFPECTVEVHVDEPPADPHPDEPSQPWDEPWGGRARDELRCQGTGPAAAVHTFTCAEGAATCDVVIPDLAPGLHRLRFVLTDAQGVSERAIVQDVTACQVHTFGVLRDREGPESPWLAVASFNPGVGPDFSPGRATPS